MSLPPASHGIMPHNYAPAVQPPLQPHRPELFGYDPSQPNSWDTHFNNLRRPVPQGSAQNLGLAHFPFLNDQPLLDPVPPTAPPATLDESGQYPFMNQTLQAWPTCTCLLCSAHPTSWPVRFDDDGWSAFASRDAMAPSAAPSLWSSPRANPAAPLHAMTPSAAPPLRSSLRVNPAASLHAVAPSAALPARSSSRANRAASLHAMPSIRSARLQFPSVANAGSGSWDLNAASGGSARSSSRSGRVPSVRSTRRARARPLIRVDDRIEWVRDDVMKMTLLFNWSPHAEAEAQELWG